MQGPVESALTCVVRCKKGAVVHFNIRCDGALRVKHARTAQCQGVDRGTIAISFCGTLSGAYPLETDLPASIGGCIIIRRESCQSNDQMASRQVLEAAVVAVNMGQTIATQKKSSPISSVRDGRLRSVNVHQEMCRRYLYTTAVALLVE
jgi:hypothetical protein